MNNSRIQMIGSIIVLIGVLMGFLIILYGFYLTFRNSIKYFYIKKHGYKKENISAKQASERWNCAVKKFIAWGDNFALELKPKNIVVAHWDESLVNYYAGTFKSGSKGIGFTLGIYIDIITGQDPEVLKWAVAHEYAHNIYDKTGTYFDILQYRKKNKIINNIREVRADIEGSRIIGITENERQQYCNYKKKAYEKYKVNEVNFKKLLSHPSWERRVEYMKKYDHFGKDNMKVIIKEVMENLEKDCNIVIKNKQKYYELFRQQI